MLFIERKPAEGEPLLYRMTHGLEQKAKWVFIDLFHPSYKSTPVFPGEPSLTNSLSHVSDGVECTPASVACVFPRPGQSTLHLWPWLRSQGLLM